MLAARWFKKPKEDETHLARSGQASRGGRRPALPHPKGARGTESAHGGGSKGQVFYHASKASIWSMLRFSLRQRWMVVLAVIGCMATLPMLFQVLPKNFIPDDDSSEFQLSIQAPEGTSLEATQVLIARIARDIRTLNGVEYTIASVADTDQRNPYQGTIYVRLVNIADREYGQLEMMDFVRKNILPKYAGDNLRISVTPGVVHVGRRHERRQTSNT